MVSKALVNKQPLITERFFEMSDSRTVVASI